jgi:hypothetical protein
MAVGLSALRAVSDLLQEIFSSTQFFYRLSKTQGYVTAEKIK